MTTIKKNTKSRHMSEWVMAKCGKLWKRFLNGFAQLSEWNFSYQSPKSALLSRAAINKRSCYAETVHLWAIYCSQLSCFWFSEQSLRIHGDNKALVFWFKASPIVVMTVNENKKDPEIVHCLSSPSELPFLCRSISFDWYVFISKSTLFKETSETNDKESLPIMH